MAPPEEISTDAGAQGNRLLDPNLTVVPTGERVPFTEKDIVGCQNNASQKNKQSPFLAA